jgi:hypothetical protein
MEYLKLENQFDNFLIFQFLKNLPSAVHFHCELPYNHR